MRPILSGMFSAVAMEVTVQDTKTRALSYADAKMRQDCRDVVAANIGSAYPLKQNKYLRASTKMICFGRNL